MDELKNNPQIIELLETLEENGMHKEKGEVSALVSYIGDMEHTLSAMLVEMQEMRKEVNMIHNSSVKAKCENLIQTADGKIRQGVAAISKAKNNLIASAAKSRKATIEYEKEQKTHVHHNDITVIEFLYEFIEKYGEKKWVASTYDGNVGLLENYVHPYWGDKKLRSIRTKTVDDFYHFLLNEAEPATNMGKPKREHISPSTIHDIHKVLRCAFNQAKKWEHIAKNPFFDAALPEHKEAKRDALTPEQLQRVLNFTDRTDIYDLYVMHCAIQLAFACCMRGGEIGGTQRERFSRSDQVLYIDRVIDRVDKKLIEKLPKMNILFRFPNLYPGTRTVIVLKQPKTEGSIRTVYIPETVAKKLEKLRETEEAPVTAAPALDAEALASLLDGNPELLKKALESVRLANNT